MKPFIFAAVLFIAGCDDGESTVVLPRDGGSPPARWEPVEWDRTGRETMPLDNIASVLAAIWRPVESCDEVAFTKELNGESYRFDLFNVFSRKRGAYVNLACEMEQHGHYVSHVARVSKEVWSDYEKRVLPVIFTFFRIQSTLGATDFVTYDLSRTRDGQARADDCEHEEKRCLFALKGAVHAIDLKSGLYDRFAIPSREEPLENNPGMTTRNEYPEETGPLAILLGGENAQAAKLIVGNPDDIPRALARRALAREVHRQYPDGSSGALDLPGSVRTTSNGIVIEDIGAAFGVRETSASYVVKLKGGPTCAPTENEDVRICDMTVETSFFAYDTRTGSRQTRIAQIANVAASGDQSGEIEAIFARNKDGWRMVVTDQIARFLSGVDRKNRWVVRTSDGRTLSGADAVQCVADPNDC